MREQKKRAYLTVVLPHVDQFGIYTSSLMLIYSSGCRKEQRIVYALILIPRCILGLEQNYHA